MTKFPVFYINEFYGFPITIVVKITKWHLKTEKNIIKWQEIFQSPTRMAVKSSKNSNLGKIKSLFNINLKLQNFHFKV